MGGRGLDSVVVGGILIPGAVRSKRVGVASIGSILRVANERLEEVLVSGMRIPLLSR